MPKSKQEMIEAIASLDASRPDVKERESRVPSDLLVDLQTVDAINALRRRVATLEANVGIADESASIEAEEEASTAKALDDAVALEVAKVNP